MKKTQLSIHTFSISHLNQHHVQIASLFSLPSLSLLLFSLLLISLFLNSSLSGWRKNEGTQITNRNTNPFFPSLFVLLIANFSTHTVTNLSNSSSGCQLEEQS